MRDLQEFMTTVNEKAKNKTEVDKILYKLPVSAKKLYIKVWINDWRFMPI
jgi:hypothetical protein